MPDDNLEQRVAALEVAVEHLVNDVALLQEQNQQVLEQLTHIADGIEGLEGWQRHIEEELARKADEEGVEETVDRIRSRIDELQQGLHSDIERLDTRIRSLEERGLPPPEILEGMIAEVVRSVISNEIQEALSEFKRAQVDPAFRDLDGRLSGLEERIRALEEAIDELRGMAPPAENIREIVLDLLKDLAIPVLDDDFYSLLPQRVVQAIVRKGQDRWAEQARFLMFLWNWAFSQILRDTWRSQALDYRNYIMGRETEHA